MNTIVETPKSTFKDLQEVYGYLFRLSESLNIVLSDFTPDNYIAAYQRSNNLFINEIKDLQSVVNRNNRSILDTYNDLKALIFNTASQVDTEMDRIERELNSSVKAVSDEWGTYKESIHTTIVETARDTITSYNYGSEIETLQEQAAGFSRYQISSEGYIRQGFIDTDEYGAPIVGIAIGQNLKAVTVTVDGEDYQRIDATQMCAFYTADKVSFRMNGEEVAYVSNKKLYINDVEITGKVTFVGKWELSFPDDDIAIDWIGGDV